jgi:hypothetical protein
MTEEEIIELANAQVALGRSPDDEALLEWVKDGWQKLGTGQEGAMLVLATKLLDGKRYRISTRSFEDAQQYRAFAEKLGAIISVSKSCERRSRPLQS